MNRIYPQIVVSKKAEISVRNGHPWVYEGEVRDCAETPKDGGIVDVISEKGKYLGSGFYNSASKIRVRLLSRNANDTFDSAFFARRVRYAIEYRKTVMGDDFSACRLIFGEADQLPGLTVDRFGDVLVTQVQCLGTEQRKGEIYHALIEILRNMGESVRILYERSEGPLRGKEGMPEFCGFYTGDGLAAEDSGQILLTENGIRYEVDYIQGQKTGFFLDQKYNRRAVARIAKEKTVLDCFTHTGAFALNAAKAGAKKVTAVDISQDAIRLAKANAERNGLTNVDFLCRNVFDLLTELKEQKEHSYDFIILDPPAFTKSNATVRNATAGYREINRTAMQVLPRGGYLATCSCSHFMTDLFFRKMLQQAAAEASVSLRQIEGRQQGPDHPILWNVPETDYLKFYLFQVI